MKFQKGMSGNPNGRPIGTPNKVSNELRSRISLFLDTEFSNVRKAFKTLEAEKKLKFYIDLLAYSIPKLSNTKLDFDVENLTEEQLKRIIEELKQSANEQKTDDRIP